MTPARLRRAVLATWLLIPLIACSDEQRAKGRKPEQMVAQLSAYNHTGDYIHQSYVDGQGAGNVFAYGGGGSFVCCIQYPKVWREGLTAKVRWTTSSSNPSASGPEAEETWHEKIVPIEHYTEPGTRLNVHFLPGNQVRLIITSMTAGWPGYPGPAAPMKPPGYPPWKH